MSRFRLSRDFKANEIFRLQLSNQQMSYIASQLPAGYSFVLEPKKNIPKHIIQATRRKLQVNQSQDSNSHQNSQLQNKNVNKNHTQAVNNKKNNTQTVAPKTTNQKSVQKNQKPSNSIANNNINPTTPNNANIPANNSSTKWIQSLNDGLKRAAKILTQLKNHKSSWPFLIPVDAQQLQIPEYYQIIKQPMDLQTIQNKLKNQKYNQFAQFNSDIMKIIENSYRFNQANEDYLKITSQFQNYFAKLSSDSSSMPQIKNTNKNNKKKKKSSVSNKQFNDTVPVTLMQKKLLAQQIRRLGKQHLKGIKQIVFDHVEQYQDVFDLQKLSQKKLRQLQKYVRNKIIAMEQRNRSNQIQKNQISNLNMYQSQESSFLTDSSDENS